MGGILSPVISAESFYSFPSEVFDRMKKVFELVKHLIFLGYEIYPYYSREIVCKGNEISRSSGGADPEWPTDVGVY